MIRTEKIAVILTAILGIFLSLPTFGFGAETIQLTDGDGTRFTTNGELDINANGEVIWIEDHTGSGGSDVLFYDSQGNITRLLTDAPLGSLQGPKLNDLGQAVWMSEPLPSSPETFLGRDPVFYNGQTINRLTNEPIVKNYDSLINNNGQIVWTGITGTDLINGYPNTHSELFFYEGNSITQLTSGGFRENSLNPDLSNTGGYITWETNHISLDGSDRVDSDIYLYHEGLTQRITNDSNGDIAPQVNSKGELVWLTLSGSNTGVNFYDGTEIRRLADFTPEDINNSPSLSAPDMNENGQVVWNLRGDIFLFDGSQTIRLTNSLDQDDLSPRINASGSVAWESYSNQYQNLGIYLYDGSGIKQLDSGGFGFNARIADNGDVVWAGREEIGNQIFLYDADAVPPPDDEEPPPVHPPDAVELQDAESIISVNDNIPQKSPAFNNGLWIMQAEGTDVRFRPGRDGFDPAKPTVVLAHGWVPDNRHGDEFFDVPFAPLGDLTIEDPFLPAWIRQTVNVVGEDCTWPNCLNIEIPDSFNTDSLLAGHTLDKPDTGVAQLLGRREDINVLAWNWAEFSSTSSYGVDLSFIPQEIDPVTQLPWPGYLVRDQGQALANALKKTFGENYEQPIHLIGHSLGGGVMTYASLQLKDFRYNVEQLSLFDAPEGKLSPSLTTLGLNDEINKAVGRDIWVDSYPTAFGENYSKAENFRIADGFPCSTSCLLKLGFFHGYPINWYFGVGDTALDGTLFKSFPYPGFPNSDVGAYLSMVLNPVQSDEAIETVRHKLGGNSVYEARNPDSLPYTLVPKNASDDQTETHSVRVDLGENTDAWLKKGDVYFLNGAYHLATRSPVFLFREYSFPNDSGYMSFDFLLENPAPEDDLLFFVGTNPLFRFQGSSFPEDWNNFLNSGPINVSEFSGTNQWLTFLYNSDEAGHRAQIANIDLYRFEETIDSSVVPEPSTLLLLGVGITGTLFCFRSRRKVVFS